MDERLCSSRELTSFSGGMATFRSQSHAPLPRETLAGWAAPSSMALQKSFYQQNQAFVGALRASEEQAPPDAATITHRFVTICNARAFDIVLAMNMP